MLLHVAALSPAAKQARIANTWSDSADSNSGCEGDDVSSDSDNSSAEAVATPPSTDDQILAKMNAGCGCQKNHFAPLSLENYKSLRQQFTGASLQHRDSYLLGVLSAGLRSTSEKTQTGSVRTRQSFMYHVHGHKVCITVFKLMFDIGGKHLRRLQKHASLGLCFSEPHENVGRKPWNTVSESDRERVVQFLKNYAAVFGLPMPAAPRGRGHTAPTFLPASNTYSSVHAEYVRAQEQETTVSLRATAENTQFLRPLGKFNEFLLT